MESVKFWTINCKLLNNNDFERFVTDLEGYILTRVGDWTLPQENSEKWLGDFVGSYEDWKGRDFKDHPLPLESYFVITERIPY